MTRMATLFRFCPPLALHPFLVKSCLVLALSASWSPTAVGQQSFDDLFGGPLKPKPAKTKPADTLPASQAVTPSASPVTPAAEQATSSPIPSPAPAVSAAPLAIQPAAVAPGRSAPVITGFFQNDLAYTYAGDSHWSRFSNTLNLASQGSLGAAAWKLEGRVVADPLYASTDHYPRAVRKDQRFEASVREAYLDFSAGDWEFRMGRQQVVWGEMVGLFFADVVSAKDLRQFVLPDFDMIRLPQWAARTEYFAGDFHAEAIWIPYMTYDDIGKPGAEFYPLAPPSIPGVQNVFARESKPTGLDDSAYGLRLSWLQDGWDVSGFYYSSNDSAAAFTRQVTPGIITYQATHPRIRQLGSTLAKDLGFTLLKAEAIYTWDKRLTTRDTLDTDGLVKQDYLDYVIGLEWSFAHESRLNIQAYQRRFNNHDANIVQDRVESGASVLYSTRILHPKLETEFLWINSLNRSDWLGQLKLTWLHDDHWRLAAGLDVFDGPSDGLFGQFNTRDRVYTEVRYSF